MHIDQQRKRKLQKKKKDNLLLLLLLLLLLASLQGRAPSGRNLNRWRSRANKTRLHNATTARTTTREDDEKGGDNVHQIIEPLNESWNRRRVIYFLLLFLTFFFFLNEKESDGEIQVALTRCLDGILWLAVKKSKEGSRVLHSFRHRNAPIDTGWRWMTQSKQI